MPGRPEMHPRANAEQRDRARVHEAGGSSRSAPTRRLQSFEDPIRRALAKRPVRSRWWRHSPRGRRAFLWPDRPCVCERTPASCPSVCHPAPPQLEQQARAAVAGRRQAQCANAAAAREAAEHCALRDRRCRSQDRSPDGRAGEGRRLMRSTILPMAKLSP